MLSQNPQDKEEAVPAIGNDWIRKYSMCRGMLTVPANETENAETGLHWFPIDKIDQGTAIVSMDTAFALTSAVGTDLGAWTQMTHACLENRISTSFFTN